LAINELMFIKKTGNTTQNILSKRTGITDRNCKKVLWSLTYDAGDKE